MGRIRRDGPKAWCAIQAGALLIAALLAGGCASGTGHPAASGSGSASASGSAPAPASGRLPCTIYGGAGTPCVAAYSTVRALYNGYRGPLYQVRRASDGRTRAISPAAPGGVADAAAQDGFCRGTQCVITEVYDQSPRHNNLTVEGAGGNGGPDHAAAASALPVTVHGQHVYGLKITPEVGYRDDHTAGVATGAMPEAMYMVASGRDVNGKCCFDFGNAEANNLDNGAGHMDAVNLSNGCKLGNCPGPGPWVKADLENGLFQSARGGRPPKPSDTGFPYPFVTALLAGNGASRFALAAGNAQGGRLAFTYTGPLPPKYQPMHQEGAVVLGTGGDNSHQGVGEFYEGVMTAGVPSASADQAVQASIVAAGYASG